MKLLNYFEKLQDSLTEWQFYYNWHRPHGSLNGKTEKVEAVIKDACLELEKRYEIAFIEIGTDADHIHLLVQASSNV